MFLIQPNSHTPCLGMSTNSLEIRSDVFFPGTCSLTADGDSLGAEDCANQPSMYLKTVYAYISKEVIKPAYWTIPTTTTVSTTTPTTTTTTTVDRTTENDSGIQSFDRSYIIASSLDEDERRMKDEAETGKKKKTHKEEKGGKGGGEVTVAKAKDQEELDKQANLVYGFVSNFFSSYKHISENQVRFFHF